MSSNYADRFDNYGGQRLEVTGDSGSSGAIVKQPEHQSQW